MLQLLSGGEPVGTCRALPGSEGQPRVTCLGKPEKGPVASPGHCGAIWRVLLDKGLPFPWHRVEAVPLGTPHAHHVGLAPASALDPFSR